MLNFKKKLKKPIVIDNLFSTDDFNDLKRHIEENENKILFDPTEDRYVFNSKYLTENFNKKLEPLAKKIFKDKSLETSYCLYVRYQGYKSQLNKHKDLNANTYLIDLCINEKTQWPIFIDGVEYKLEPNQAVAFLPMEWEHWRNQFPDPNNNIVEIIMFYFVPKNDEGWIKNKDLLQNNYIQDIKVEKK